MQMVDTDQIMEEQKEEIEALNKQIQQLHRHQAILSRKLIQKPSNTEGQSANFPTQIGIPENLIQLNKHLKSQASALSKQEDKMEATLQQLRELLNQEELKCIELKGKYPPEIDLDALEQTNLEANQRLYYQHLVKKSSTEDHIHSIQTSQHRLAAIVKRELKSIEAENQDMKQSLEEQENLIAKQMDQLEKAAEAVGRQRQETENALAKIQREVSLAESIRQSRLPSRGSRDRDFRRSRDLLSGHPSKGRIEPSRSQSILRKESAQSSRDENQERYITINFNRQMKQQIDQYDIDDQAKKLIYGCFEEDQNEGNPKPEDDPKNGTDELDDDQESSQVSGNRQRSRIYDQGKPLAAKNKINPEVVNFDD